LPHCPFVFLRSTVYLPPFRGLSLRRRPGGSATVGVTSPRREPFIPIDQTPAGHTSAELHSAVSRIFNPLRLASSKRIAHGDRLPNTIGRYTQPAVRVLVSLERI